MIQLVFPVVCNFTKFISSQVELLEKFERKLVTRIEEEYKVVETDCLENFGVQNRDIGGLAIGKKLFLKFTVQ